MARHQNISTGTLFVMAVSLSSCGQGPQSSIHGTKEPPKTPSGIWAQVASDPYDGLPQNQVSLWKFASSRFNPSPDKLVKRGKATLKSKESIVPYFQKLVHPNGICLKGEWVVNEPNPYTGYFKSGTRAPFLGRASVAMSETTRGEYRAFGLAGKIFHKESTPKGAGDTFDVAHFFTVDDLAGTLLGDYVATTLRNEPKLTKRNLVWQGPKVMAIGAATTAAFLLADKNPGIRQLYEISELGEADKANTVTPKWMNLTSDSQLKKKHADFRDDLRASNFKDPLRFNIQVASETEPWQQIGYIEITHSTVSESCDHRLHFHHPRFREDI